jgi:TRAP-type C4-dicarboxylate transport system substrate-binding protein
MKKISKFDHLGEDILNRAADGVPDKDFAEAVKTLVETMHILELAGWIAGCLDHKKIRAELKDIICEVFEEEEMERNEKLERNRERRRQGPY